MEPLASGLTIDLTRTQFSNGEAFEPPVLQEPLASTRTRQRYELLSRRVRAKLGLC